MTATREQLEQKLLHTETLPVCTVSGAVGCLGWPEWHEGDCVYVDIEFCFCKCGGHNVYGEMYHKESCPLYVPEEEEAP